MSKKKWSPEAKEKLYNAVFHPKCEKCFCTGVIPGPTFDGNDPNTYEDFTYCDCEVGVATQHSDMRRLVDEQMETPPIT